MRTRSLISAAALAAASTVAFAGPAAAQPQQNGLVNVNVTDVAVVVPVAVAANVCDLNVAVLVQDLQDDAADCQADADNNLEITQGPDTGGPAQQEGLVNLNLEDITVAIPIALAANVCDVNVAVLVADLQDAAAQCDADAGNEVTVIQ
jgi:hypothetical protein